MIVLAVKCSDVVNSFVIAGFRCCYCYHVNEARKQKPRAPSLDVHEAPSITQRPSESGTYTLHDTRITGTSASA